MAISKDDILSAIEEMSVMDLVELISAIEEKFGVTAAAVTPNFSSIAEISSTKSITDISSIALRISSLDIAIFFS